ncbi:alanine racemase [Endozoicomonas numazuensis]|uniref:Alanine racemase n=1 Tax=Endozoicomonas numazuensis TaxID=1137799 RepID=A0A081NCY9_9GAMM|nr:alanine racemase [Endozoicomonas numazuensis]KEQ16312.1 alanine racemase [Endozoicomonas numazuensis]
MSRPARAVIHLDALKHNYRLAKSLAGEGNALAVVKADAYGHGAISCAQSLSDEADGFAVACIEEALELRAAGIRNRMLILEGFFDPSELTEIASENLDIVVHNPEQIRILEQTPLDKPVRVWLKMDSGMHRVGILPDQYRDAWIRLEQLPWINEILLMTHLACADEPDNGYTLQQLETFERHTLGLPGERSIANSAGLIHCASARADWSRPGLMLYGASPFDRSHEIESTLKPVMELQSAIISIKEIPAGSPVGYAGTAVTQKTTRLGVIAIGYADGYPLAPNGTPVVVNGQSVPLIGRVSMDMLTIDLSEVEGVNVGDPALLWGKDLPVTEIARHAGTIPYQLLCNLNRVPVSYTQQVKHKETA